MKILFLTMTRFGDGTEHGIYTDLMRNFCDEGHEVYVVYPVERGLSPKSSSERTDLHWQKVNCGYLLQYDRMHILGVRTLKVQKTNVIEKGLGQVLLEPLFKRAIGKYFKGVRFDLILYSTPPITLVNAIRFVKRQNPEARTYLMLKDIFPQNAVDLGMISDKFIVHSPQNTVHSSQGIAQRVKGMATYFLYRRFRRKEQKLYAISDFIGCMSPANVKYVLAHNPEVALRQAQGPVVEICPNSYEVRSAEGIRHSLRSKVHSSECTEHSSECTGHSSEYIVHSAAVRTKFGLPVDKPIFIYGGNMGKPQGIPFLLECLKASKNRTDCHFVVVGNGTEYPKIESWVKSENPASVTLFQRLPKDEYDILANACDVGLIFLDYRFTIPNYPSRLLPYLMGKKPIIACTDPNCDTGTIAEANGYGLWVPSNDVNVFTKAVDKMLVSDIVSMGEKGYEYYLSNYTVENSYNAIIKHFDTVCNSKKRC